MSLVESSTPAHSTKKFGLLNAISINMSAMVGTGPFITVPAILATMGGPQSLICWALGAVIAIADGLVFAELGTSFPSSGGTYNYLRACFGPERWGRLMAWLFVWQFLFSGTLEIATGTVGMAAYSTFLFRGLVLHPWAIRLLAASFSLISMLLLYRKIRDIARILFVLWIGMLLTSAWVIFEGILHLQSRLLFDIPTGAFHPNAAFWLGMGNGTMLVMYNFLGYYNICHLAGEVRRPERVIPYSIIGSIILVLLLDAGISVAFTGVLPWREMIQPGTLTYNAVGSVFMHRVAGRWASGAITILILVTAFASTYSMMLGYSRIPYAAALDGNFLHYFAKTHSTKDFPHRALLLVGVLSTIASFFNLVEIITTLLMARILIMFVAQIIGLLLLRRARPDVPRPFRMWLYPLPALFAMVFWFSIFSSQAFEPEGWRYVVAVLAVFATGAVLYLVVAKRQHHWPFLLPKGELAQSEQAHP